MALGAAARTQRAPLEDPQDGGGCASDLECKVDRICYQGTCVDPSLPGDGGVDGGVDGGMDAGVDGGSETPPAPGELGGACGTGAGADCIDPGAVCVGDLPGGYCAIPGCGGCPASGVCVMTDQGEPACVQACETDAACRPGYACNASLGAPACLPSQGGGSTPVGGACATNADCEGIPAYCIDQWPGGYCIYGDCAACPEGAACVRDRDFSACMATCQSNTDCRDGYICINYAGASFCFYNGP